MRKALKLDAYMALAGQELGTSDWFEIDQSRINAFADVTEDHQFIHIDPVRAKAETPFGDAIAHGFLTLSLLSHLNMQVLPDIEGRAMTINYGMNKLRFLNPVKVGSRVRSKVTMQSATEKAPGQLLVQYEAVVEIEGVDKPALVAEQLALHILGAG
ncbi:MAG: MaoC family dehydratase [Rhodobacteraceae bacterium]|nr:MaoC family dehydratase [Paracoccaceae bacterium]